MPVVPLVLVEPVLMLELSLWGVVEEVPVALELPLCGVAEVDPLIFP